MKNLRLGDVCEVMDVDHKMPKAQQKGVPFISAKDLDIIHGISFANCKFISEEDYLKQRKKSSPKKNDVLFSRIGTIGVAGLVKTDLRFGISYSLCIIRPSERVLPEYLEHLMNSQLISSQAKKGTKSIAVPDLGLGQIRDFQVPLPSYETQKQIAEILTKAKEIKQRREQANLMANKILQAVFSDMFERKDFLKEPIGKHVVETEARNPREYPDDYFKYVDIAGVDNQWGRIVEYRNILGQNAPSRARRVIKKDDVIVSTVRPNLNATAIVPSELDNQICSTGFTVLRCRKELNPKYLYVYTRKKEFVNSLTARMKGAAYPAVTNNDVLNIPIPIPPIELQNEFALIAATVEKTMEKQKHSSEETDTLFDSFMSKAFKGELLH